MPDILERALSRKAYCQEQGHPESDHMDALATLGDAVIELHILTRLVEGGGCDKGEISVKKMDLVNMSILRRAGRKQFIFMSIFTGEMVRGICISGHQGVFLQNALKHWSALYTLMEDYTVPDKLWIRSGFFPQI